MATYNESHLPFGGTRVRGRAGGRGMGTSTSMGRGGAKGLIVAILGHLRRRCDVNDAMGSEGQKI